MLSQSRQALLRDRTTEDTLKEGAQKYERANLPRVGGLRLRRMTVG